MRRLLSVNGRYEGLWMLPLALVFVLTACGGEKPSNGGGDTSDSDVTDETDATDSDTGDDATEDTGEDTAVDTGEDAADTGEDASGCDDSMVGQSCGDCGTWVCEDDAMSCDDPGTNECGGCGDLGVTIGEACDLSGQVGAWVCDTDSGDAICEVDPSTNG